jgi:hypothetical protein
LIRTSALASRSKRLRARLVAKNPRVQQVLRGLAGGYDGGIAWVTNRP